MHSVLIVIHLFVAIGLVSLILLQRSEGGALGMGGGPGGLMSGRQAGNVLTRATTGLALVFFATSIGLTIMANLGSQSGGTVIDRVGDAPAGAMTPAPASAPAGAITGDDLGDLFGAQPAESSSETPPAEPVQPEAP